MRDDKLQGILFSEAVLIDLSARKPHERVIQRMLAKKNELHKWSVRKRYTLKHTLASNSNGYAVSARRRRQYDIETEQLYLKLGLNSAPTAHKEEL